MIGGWKEYKLSEIGSFKNGANFSSDKMGRGVPLVNVKDITDSPLLHPERMDLVDLDISSKSGAAYLAKDGDIFFVRSSVKREGVGAVGMLKNNNSLVVHCGFVIRFRIESTEILPRFAFYLLNTSFNREKVRNISGGATIVNISQGSLKMLKFPFPSLPIQRKIARILSSYDDLIENNLKRIKLLEEMAQRTYEEWFVRFKFPGHENTQINDETGLPDGWEMSTLGALVELVKDTVNPSEIEPTTPYIGLEHIPRKSITLSTWETAQKVDSTKYWFRKYDILFGKIRPYFHKVGFTIVDGITSTDSIILRPLDLKLHGLVLQTVFTERFVDTATQSSNGTKMPRANWNVLSNYPVAVPTVQLLIKYQELSANILNLIGTLVQQNQLLKEARDILLPRLMTGVIDVDGLEVGEIVKEG